MGFIGAGKSAPAAAGGGFCKPGKNLAAADKIIETMDC